MSDVQYDSRDMGSRGRIGGYRLRATRDPLTYTASARKAFLDRFIPDDPNLSEEERLARGTAALRAYMASLARKSVQARRKSRGGK